MEKGSISVIRMPAGPVRAEKVLQFREFENKREEPSLDEGSSLLRFPGVILTFVIMRPRILYALIKRGYALREVASFRQLVLDYLF